MKPSWLKVKIPSGKEYNRINSILKNGNLHTVCQEARCPNIGECSKAGTATFMIMGDTCTRNCKYCNVNHNTPGPLDDNEPIKIARAIKALGLKYAVITSVTRDDLTDQGAQHFYDTVTEIKKLNPNCNIEILTPDFQGDSEAIKKVISSEPYVFNHNIEVTKNLFNEVRPQGDYNLSLKVLSDVKSLFSAILTKSGMMIGLGETTADIKLTIDDLKNSNVDILTIGQYLQPRKDLQEVKKYYTPEEFESLKQYALSLGFKKVFSSPLVRSSYHADQAQS